MIRDAWAGLKLASMNIPQLMGYARIAGMPVVTGLYSAILPIIAFATFGVSRHLVVAADSATATILANKLSTMAPVASEKYIMLAGMSALLTAGFLLLARIFRLGFLSDFLSRTVLVGFLAGVGVQVGITMLGDMFGISVPSSRVIDQVDIIFHGIHQTHLLTFWISLVVVSCILGGKYYLPRLPIALFAVIIGIAASYAYDFSGHGISVIGPIAGGLPTIAFPGVSWKETLDLLPVATSCFVIIIAQSAVASRFYAEQYHERFDANADILGLAAANASAALSGTFIVNGSPTQTAMADQAGARSQFAQLVFAGTVVMVLLFMSRIIQYLPHCVLASIVFTIAIGLVDIKKLNAIRSESPGEFNLALIAAAAVVLVGVEYGILLAVALSLIRHVRHSYHPHTQMMVKGHEGRWMPVRAMPGNETEPGLIIYRFEADLFFANEHSFVDEIDQLIEHAPTPVHWFVVDAAAITDLDYSAGRSVCEMCDSLSHRGVIVIFARVSGYLRSDMDRHGITAVVGENRIFETLHEALVTVGTSPECISNPI